MGYYTCCNWICDQLCHACYRKVLSWRLWVMFESRVCLDHFIVVEKRGTVFTSCSLVLCQWLVWSSKRVCQLSLLLDLSLMPSPVLSSSVLLISTLPKCSRINGCSSLWVCLPCNSTVTNICEAGSHYSCLWKFSLVDPPRFSPHCKVPRRAWKDHCCRASEVKQDWGEECSSQTVPSHRSSQGFESLDASCGYFLPQHDEFSSDERKFCFVPAG